MTRPPLRWGQGSTVYSCGHCGRQLQSAWRIKPNQPDPAAFTAGYQVWRHAGTRRAACATNVTSAAPR